MTPYDVVTVTLNPALDWTLQIPGFAAGKVNRVVSERTRAGGKGVNVAAALAATHRVAATGFLGRDNASHFERFFAEERIADELVRVDGATRVGIKIAGDDTTDINFPGFPVVDIPKLRQRVAQLAETHPYFVLAGSIPPNVDPTIYRDLMNDLQGCRVALDTSGDALRFALDARPDVIKPNIHELEALTGESLPDEAAVLAAARSLIARGIALVVVSMGEQGALFVTAEEALIARPPSIAVNSTVGAGDAMVAGIVSAQLAGSSLEDLARTATAFSLRALGGGELEPLGASVTIEFGVR